MSVTAKVGWIGAARRETSDGIAKISCDTNLPRSAFDPYLSPRP